MEDIQKLQEWIQERTKDATLEEFRELIISEKQAQAIHSKTHRFRGYFPSATDEL
jgi:ribosomal protein S3AE